MRLISKFKKALAVVFPEQCCVCSSASETPVCITCQHTLMNDLCIRKEKIDMDLTYLFSYTHPILNKWLHEIKFDGNDRAARELSAYLIRTGTLLTSFKVDIVIPIPIHPKKKRKRGFNHVDLILKEWILEHKVSYMDIVSRKKNTKPLFELSIEERHSELENAFELNSSYTPELLNDKTVCLVDDIYTTGATVSSVARLLNQYGVAEITVVTLSRT